MPVSGSTQPDVPNLTMRKVEGLSIDQELRHGTMYLDIDHDDVVPALRSEDAEDVFIAFLRAVWATVSDKSGEWFDLAILPDEKRNVDFLLEELIEVWFLLSSHVKVSLVRTD